MGLSFLHIVKNFLISLFFVNIIKNQEKLGIFCKPKSLKTWNSQIQKLLEALNPNPFKPDTYYAPKRES